MATPIETFAAAVQPFLTQITTDLDNIKTGVQALDDLITQLQNSPGTITPADQALLDQIQAASQALVAQADAINTTPPVAPAKP